MCFYQDDYDWIAQVADETEPVATGKIRCDECGMGIPRGVKYHHTLLQQYEECRDCFNEECECPEKSDGRKNCCQCDEPNFGETSTYACCDHCHKFLCAVQDAEQEAGCDYRDSRPPLGEMVSCIGEVGAEKAKKYWRVAAMEYPELRSNGYLVWLWRKMFSE